MLRLSRKESPDRVVELDLSKRLHVFTGEPYPLLEEGLISGYRGFRVGVYGWNLEADRDEELAKASITRRDAHHLTPGTRFQEDVVNRLTYKFEEEGSCVILLTYPGACTTEQQMVELVGDILALTKDHYVILRVNNPIVLDTIRLYVYLSEMRDFMKMTVAERFQVLQNANWSISDNSHLLVKDWDAYWYKRVGQEGLPLRSDIELPEEKVGFYLVRKEKVSEIHLGGWLPPAQVYRSFNNLIDVITDDLYVMEDD